MLITSANSLGPDQDQQIISPHVDLHCLTLCGIPVSFFHKVDIKKNQKNKERSQNYPLLKKLKKLFQNRL